MTQLLPALSSVPDAQNQKHSIFANRVLNYIAILPEEGRCFPNRWRFGPVSKSGHVLKQFQPAPDHLHGAYSCFHILDSKKRIKPLHIRNGLRRKFDHKTLRGLGGGNSSAVPQLRTHALTSSSGTASWVRLSSSSRSSASSISSPSLSAARSSNASAITMSASCPRWAASAFKRASASLSRSIA